MSKRPQEPAGPDSGSTSAQPGGGLMEEQRRWVHRYSGIEPIVGAKGKGPPAGVVDDQGVVQMPPVDVPAPHARRASGHHGPPDHSSPPGQPPGAPSPVPGGGHAPAGSAREEAPGGVNPPGRPFSHSFELARVSLPVWQRRLELSVQLSADVSLRYEIADGGGTDVTAPTLEVLERWAEGVRRDLTSGGAVWDGARLERHGTQIRLHAASETPFGTLAGNLVLVGVDVARVGANVEARPEILQAELSLSPHAVELPDQTVGGFRLTQIRCRLTGHAELAPDWNLIVAQYAARELAADAVEGGETLVAEVGLDTLGAIAGACASCFVFVEALMQAWQLSHLLGAAAHINDRMQIGFLEAFAGRSPTGDPFEQTGYAYGQRVYQTALAALQQSHPGQSEDRYRQAMLAQAEAAYRSAAGRIAAAARTAAWDGYLRGNPRVLIWQDARRAYALLFGHDPSDDSPDAEWSKYLQHYPVQRYL